MSPGRIVLPPRSIVSAPGGIASRGPTFSTRSPSTITTTSSTRRPAVGSIRWAARIAMRRTADGGCCPLIVAASAAASATHAAACARGIRFMDVEPTTEKAVRFRALHDGPAFVIPNPWDVESARILSGLGFVALATSSAASACAIGRKDGELTREQALDHARAIAAATNLPVSADLERAFGDSPEAVADTVRL